MFNYYGTLDYYDENLIVYPDTNIVWNNFNINQKMAILQNISKEIDINAKWVGMKYDINQLLEFPRDFTNIWIKANLEDFYYRNHNKVPLILNDVVIQLLNNKYGSEKYTAMQEAGIKSISDNLISISFDKPLIKKDIISLTDKYLFEYTIMGYTQYKRSSGF